MRERKRRNNYSKSEQLCWSCKNACGGCPWSKNLTPVEGWIAEPTVIRDSGKPAMHSYKITYCPKYIRG